MSVRLTGRFDVRAWPLSVCTFLLGFMLVAVVFGVVNTFATAVPKGLSDEARAAAEKAGAARGRYLAGRDARDFAVDRAPGDAGEEIEARSASGDPDEAYRRAYGYDWNDAAAGRNAPR